MGWGDILTIKELREENERLKRQLEEEGRELSEAHDRIMQLEETIAILNREPNG